MSRLEFFENYPATHGILLRLNYFRLPPNIRMQVGRAIDNMLRAIGAPKIYDGGPKLFYFPLDVEAELKKPSSTLKNHFTLAIAILINQAIAAQYFATLVPPKGVVRTPRIDRAEELFDRTIEGYREEYNLMPDLFKDTDTMGNAWLLDTHILTLNHQITNLQLIRNQYHYHVVTPQIVNAMQANFSSFILGDAQPGTPKYAKRLEIVEQIQERLDAIGQNLMPKVRLQRENKLLELIEQEFGQEQEGEATSAENEIERITEKNQRRSIAEQKLSLNRQIELVGILRDAVQQRDEVENVAEEDRAQPIIKETTASTNKVVKQKEAEYGIQQCDKVLTQMRAQRRDLVSQREALRTEAGNGNRRFGIYRTLIEKGEAQSEQLLTDAADDLSPEDVANYSQTCASLLATLEELKQGSCTLEGGRIHRTQDGTDITERVKLQMVATNQIGNEHVDHVDGFFVKELAEQQIHFDVKTAAATSTEPEQSDETTLSTSQTAVIDNTAAAVDEAAQEATDESMAISEQATVLAEKIGDIDFSEKTLEDFPEVKKTVIDLVEESNIDQELQGRINSMINQIENTSAPEDIEDFQEAYERRYSDNIKDEKLNQTMEQFFEYSIRISSGNAPTHQ